MRALQWEREAKTESWRVLSSFQSHFSSPLLSGVRNTNTIWVLKEEDKSHMGLYTSVCCILLVAVLNVSFTNGEDPYRFYNWNVTYGDIYPLGVKQQVILSVLYLSYTHTHTHKNKHGFCAVFLFWVFLLLRKRTMSDC